MKTKPLSKNFSWEVTEQPLYINGNSSNYKALIRSDNGKTLNVMTNQYHTFRNRELMRLADRIAAKGNFSVEGFDEFKGGKKVIGYLRNLNPGLAINGEKAREYMLIGNTHDGSGCMFTGTAHYLIRCENQFSKQLRTFEARHIRDIDFYQTEIQAIIENYETGRKNLYDTLGTLKDIRANKYVIDELVKHLLKIEKLDSSSPVTSREQLLRESIDREIKSLGNNLWGVFNGVTLYTSHYLQTRQYSLGAVSGVGEEINSKAMEFMEAIRRRN